MPTIRPWSATRRPALKLLVAESGLGVRFFRKLLVCVHGSVSALEDLGGSFARLPSSHANRRIHSDLYFFRIAIELDCIFAEYPFLQALDQGGRRGRHNPQIDLGL